MLFYELVDDESSDGCYCSDEEIRLILRGWISWEPLRRGEAQGATDHCVMQQRESVSNCAMKDASDTKAIPRISKHVDA